MSDKKQTGALHTQKNKNEESKKLESKSKKLEKPEAEHEGCCGFCHEPKEIKKKKK